jgi:hypothetical protein
MRPKHSPKWRMLRAACLRLHQRELTAGSRVQNLRKENDSGDDGYPFRLPSELSSILLPNVGGPRDPHLIRTRIPGVCPELCRGAATRVPSPRRPGRMVRDQAEAVGAHSFGGRSFLVQNRAHSCVRRLIFLAWRKVRTHREKQKESSLKSEI